MNINGNKIIDLNDIESSSIIGLRIKSIRVKKRISQTTVGTRMDKDQTFICKLEKGNGPVTDLVILSNVAMALGVNIYDLIKEEENFIC